MSYITLYLIRRVCRDERRRTKWVGRRSLERSGPPVRKKSTSDDWSGAPIIIATESCGPLRRAGRGQEVAPPRLVCRPERISGETFTAFHIATPSLHIKSGGRDGVASVLSFAAASPPGLGPVTCTAAIQPSTLCPDHGNFLRCAFLDRDC